MGNEEEGFFCTKKKDDKCKPDGRCVMDENEAKKFKKGGKLAREAAAKKALKKAFAKEGDEECAELFKRVEEVGAAMKHKFKPVAGAEPSPEDADPADQEGEQEQEG